jgi:hypothetical protein
MKKLNLIAVIAFAMTIMSLTASAQVVGGYRDRQVRDLLGRIETRTDSFKREIDFSINRTPISGTSREDRIADFIAAFETSTDALRRNFASNQNISGDVNDVLSRALFINRFMSRNRLSTRAQSEWNYLRTDLNSLARIFSVTGIGIACLITDRLRELAADTGEVMAAAAVDEDSTRASPVRTG